jgi:hypothetical protein
MAHWLGSQDQARSAARPGFQPVDFKASENQELKPKRMKSIYCELLFSNSSPFDFFLPPHHGPTGRRAVVASPLEGLGVRSIALAA